MKIVIKNLNFRIKSYQKSFNERRLKGDEQSVGSRIGFLYLPFQSLYSLRLIKVCWCMHILKLQVGTDFLIKVGQLQSWQKAHFINSYNTLAQKKMFTTITVKRLERLMHTIPHGWQGRHNVYFDNLLSCSCSFDVYHYRFNDHFWRGCCSSSGWNGCEQWSDFLEKCFDKNHHYYRSD